MLVIAGEMREGLRVKFDHDGATSDPAAASVDEVDATGVATEAHFLEAYKSRKRMMR